MTIEMSRGATLQDVPSPFREALEARGFEELTAVQRAVLVEELVDSDLRVSSQTGSGKTVALGLVLGRMFQAQGIVPGRAPFALVITPTRELAAQVAAELTWLFAPVQARVVVVTGGTSAGRERADIHKGAALVVGTPGRLLDHLRRGSLDPSKVRAVVLDEADRMLDMGFTEDLRAILDAVPEGRRTHMVSATFPREVLRLADAYQTNAVDVEGTRRGDANADIAHVVHIVPGGDRESAIVNLLLLAPDELTLAFTRTREGASQLAQSLSRAGFSVAALTGEMEQSERTRALESFKVGNTKVLVATDVAGRGIDLPDVTRIIHADPPGDPESYTHRSGRTGRAGRKGTSIMLVTPAGKEQARRLLRRAGIYAELRALPTSEDVREARLRRLADDLAREPEGALRPHAEAARALAAELLASGDASPELLVARLLERALDAMPASPRELSPSARVAPRVEREERPHDGAPTRSGPRFERPPGPGVHDAPPRPSPQEFVPFSVTWGARAGADARRLMALCCRRGEVRGSDLGAIHVDPEGSIVEVSAGVAAAFERAVRRPDPRDPHIRIARFEHTRDSKPGEGPLPSSPYLPDLDDDDPRHHFPKTLERPRDDAGPRPPFRPPPGKGAPFRPPSAAVSREGASPRPPFRARPERSSEGAGPHPYVPRAPRVDKPNRAEPRRFDKATRPAPGGHKPPTRSK